MRTKNSIYIRPIIVLIDLILINIIAYSVSYKDFFNVYFLSYSCISWLFISYYTKFYNVYRYTHISKLLTQSLAQYFIYLLAFLSYFSVFREGQIVNNQALFFIYTIISITFFKFLIFFLLKKYRSDGKNYRNIILFGSYSSARVLEDLFHYKNDLGYRFCGFFSDKIFESKKYLGHTNDGFSYTLNNDIDEVYCNPKDLSQNQLIEIRKFVEKNKLDLRLIPENKAIYSKRLELEYFGTVPILKPKSLPFERLETRITKRVFDIIFSVFIIIFILSWLLPILFIAIKLNSKGPIFFKQKRDGLNGNQFYCYKLRSMNVNNDAHKVSAKKDDKRITKVGAFLRRTSLDELPQFFNVLIGDMSIVGPRPHINVQTKKYIKEVENYLVRNSVKPGITGLAQISGYRGEVINKSDIENRVRLDIFYIENWSFFLDVKIIIQTFFNFFRKEEKAY